MSSLLPTMVEGGGCAVMVDASVSGCGCRNNGRGEGWRVRLLAKKRERRIIIILYDYLSYYPMLSQNISKCATATVSCVLKKTIKLREHPASGVLYSA